MPSQPSGAAAVASGDVFGNADDDNSNNNSSSNDDDNDEQQPRPQRRTNNPTHWAPTLLQQSGRLFQEWLVTQVFRMEQLQLLYHEQRLKRLVAGLPPDQRHLRLPASFVGSPAYYRRKRDEGLTVCARRGKPTLFITMTANPKWPELVRDRVTPSASDSDNCVAANDVFAAKLKMLLHLIMSGEAFGVCGEW